MARAPAPQAVGEFDRVRAHRCDATRLHANPRERWAWAGLFAIALAIRLVDLGSRPYQFDEGQIGYAAYVLSEHGDYRYMPVLHGPLNYELSALSHSVFGTVNVANRLPAALAGAILTILPYALRRQLGGGAAFAAGVGLCLSPTLLYYSRFGREELLLVCISLAFVVTVASLVRRPSRWHLPLLGALLGLSFATKEATFLHVPIGIAAGAAWLRLRRPVELRPLLRAGRWWLSGVAVFVFVFAMLFSQFGTHLAGIVDGAYEGPKYWADEHGRQRGGEDWFAYLILLVAYELPLLVLATIGGVWSLRRRHALGTGLVVATVLTLAVYSYAGERFAWLLANTLLPLVLLAGLGFAVLWRARRNVAVAVTAAVAAALAWSNVHVQILHPNDPRELMTVAPTADAVPAISTRLRRRDASAFATGRPRPTIEVDPSSGAASPWSWYLRGLPAGYPDMAASGFAPRGDVLIVTDSSRRALEASLRGYDGTRFVLRFRRPPIGTGLTPGGLLRWFVHRTSWATISAEHEWLYVRRVPRAGGRVHPLP